MRHATHACFCKAFIKTEKSSGGELTQNAECEPPEGDPHGVAPLAVVWVEMGQHAHTCRTAREGSQASY